MADDDDDVQGDFASACLAGNVGLVRELIERVDINLPDDSGSPGLLLASCFGFKDIVQLLLQHGADVNAHDSRGWSALMWATNNRHAEIVRLLLEHGAQADLQTSSGATAGDFVDDTDLELKDSLGIQSIGVTSGDFYNAGLDLEENLREEERSHRMAAEAGMNLEIDLGALSLEASDEQPLELDDSPFTWDRCLPSQMFVFDNESVPELMRLVIDEYAPRRSRQHKLVPANLLFLAARFAHYYGSQSMLEALLDQAVMAIERSINARHEDMTTLSFWISNCLVLQYYLRKDPGTAEASAAAQLRLAELVSEAYVLLVRDAERRIEKTLNESILDYSAIDGLSQIEMSDEWRLFRKANKVPKEGHLSPRRRHGPSPRSVTSLLSSTLFVLEAYEIHQLLVVQVFAQILHWLATELFNRIVGNHKYMSRSKAMDLRMNWSQVEDWLRLNNRSWGSTMDLLGRAQKAMRPLVGLLQLLQCISSLSEDEVRPLVSSIEGITARQARHVAEHYRAERGEPKIARAVKTSLAALEREESATPLPVTEGVFLNATQQLTFSLPSSTDLILSYGAGIGGTQRDNERLFIPVLPTETVEKLDAASGGLSHEDRAKGYAAGLGRAMTSAGSKDFLALEREQQDLQVADLVGRDAGVW
ncbi:hypothetical protein PYCC9005_002094 [Savitreella phatthalungensis]